MLTQFDKAIAGGVVSALANWLLMHYHITLPADFQAALSAMIVAVIVWATPNMEKALGQPGGGVQNQQGQKP